MNECSNRCDTFRNGAFFYLKYLVNLRKMVKKNLVLTLEHIQRCINYHIHYIEHILEYKQWYINYLEGNVFVLALTSKARKNKFKDNFYWNVKYYKYRKFYKFTSILNFHITWVEKRRKGSRRFDASEHKCLYPSFVTKFE